METQTETGVGTRNWDIAVARPDHAFVWKNVDFEALDLESNGML